MTKTNAQDKPPYGRLRVLTAPPTSVQDMVTRPSSAFGFDNVHATDIDGKGEQYPSKSVTPQENIQSMTSSAVAKRLHIKSGSGSHRYGIGNRDHSVTQFAVIDDENISALQQVCFILFESTAK